MFGRLILGFYSLEWKDEAYFKWGLWGMEEVI